MDSSDSLAARRSKLSPEKRALLERRLKGGGVPAGVAIPPRASPTSAPLSFAQGRLWLVDRLERTSAYNEQIVVELEGQLDAAALEGALAGVVARHEVLRTTFELAGDEPVQRIHAQVPVQLARVDLLGAAPGEQMERVRERVREEAAARFDLRVPPLLRAALLQLAEGRWVLVCTLHHIVYDGWSLGVLMAELAVLYPALREGRPAALPPLPLQYGDYAAWQRQRTAGPGFDEALAYWTRRLGGVAPMELPTDRPRPAFPSGRGGTAARTLPPALAERVGAFAQAQGCTPYVVLLTAFKVLLQRYSAQEDVCVGTPVAGRTQPELEPLIGFFVNTLVLRTQLPPEQTVEEALRRVRETALEALANQEMPFERVVTALDLPRGASRRPLFQAMFILQNAPIPQISLPELTLRLLRLPSGTAKFDLTLSLTPGAAGLTAQLEYSAELFDEATAARMLGHYQNLLEAMLQRPAARLGALPLMDAQEQAQELSRGQRARHPPAAPGASTSTFVGLFEAQVARTPDRVAVCFEGAEVTYRALDARANQLAQLLRARGLRREDKVALCLPRSVELLEGVLAVLKAGGAYVPIDASLPPERVRFMLEESDCRFLLAQSDDALGGLEAARTERVLLSREQAALARFDPGRASLPELFAAQLAYVIFTSGSTGRPKAVQLQHSSLWRFLVEMQRALALGPDEVVLGTTTLAFDISGLELFLPLTVGARVVILATETARDGVRLVAAQEASGATLMQGTPTTYRMALAAGFEGGPNLKLLCGGEAVTPELGRQLLPRCASLWNVYGPTEATIWTSARRVERAEDAGHVGAPVPGNDLLVLDEQLQPVPLGVPGELFIGGAFLARGYARRPELTAERFIPDPTGATPGGRLYRTGDRCRWREEGVLEFLGRLDFQLKVRGHRIELGEIEAVLMEHPGVRQAAVIARQFGADDTRLLAYVVAKPGHSLAPPALEQAARQRLPEYMVPASFTVLADLPLTVSGKLERRALPEPIFAAPPTEAEEPPRAGTEEVLAAAFAEVLGTGAVGRHQDFFRAGGHSLHVAQLLARVYGAFGVELPAREVLAQPTVARLAEVIDAAVAGLAPAARPALDLAAEAVLPPQVCAQVAPLGPPTPPRQILLTGATGFLGPHLLEALLSRTDAEIHCLVRAPTPQAGLARLREALDACQVTPCAPERIRVLCGELSEPGLGLTGAQRVALARELDLIVHNGAWVNHLYPYGMLKPANVDGTDALLALAGEGRTKPLHFVSTLNVLDAYPPRPADLWRESDVRAAEEVSPQGYLQSKWVAEQHVLEAGRRGLPVAIYRPNVISGDSRTGSWPTQAAACRLLKACIATGTAPELDNLYNITPVDYVAQAVAALALTRASLGRVLHLVNPHPAPWSQVVQWISELGYPLQRVPYGRWRDGVAKHVAGIPAEATLGAGRIDCAGALAALEGTGIRCPPLDRALLETYLRHFARVGFIPAP